MNRWIKGATARLVKGIRYPLGISIRRVQAVRQKALLRRRKRRCVSMYPPSPCDAPAVLLDVSVRENLMHLFPLYEALAVRRVKPVRLVLRDACESIREEAIVLGVPAKDLLMGDNFRLLEQAPRVVVHSDQGWDWLHEPPSAVPRVQIFHGCVMKDTKDFTNALAALTRYDHYCFPGPLYREIFERRIVPHIDHAFDLHNTGMPRTDAIVQLPSETRGAKTRLGCDPERLAVLYAPTWHPEASFIRHGYTIVESILSVGATCLVRPHPGMLHATSGRLGTVTRRVMEQVASLPNVVLCDTVNSLDVMAASDALVADFGTMAFEFLLLDRPIVFFDTPEYHDVVESDSLDIWGRNVGETVSAPAAVARALERALEKPDARNTVRAELLDRLYYNVGCAARNVSEVVESVTAVER